MFRSGDPWPGIWESLPPEFITFREESAFDTKNSTFCIWRTHLDEEWQRGTVEFPASLPDPDGSESMLSMLDGRPESYVAHASAYHEVEVPLDVVAAVYEHVPLAEELVRKLNSDVSLASLSPDIAEIGYPEAG